jgi:hypothetical protein
MSLQKIWCTGYVTAAKYLGTDYDPYTFSGGRKAVSASGAFTSPTDYVTKYNWRYGSVYYPSAPIELNQDSTVALETTLATFDLKGNELPFMTPRRRTRRDPPLASSPAILFWHTTSTRPPRRCSVG